MEELLEAIKAGDVAAVEAMLDGDPSLLRATTESGISALTMSMYYGQPAIAATFVKRGAVLDMFESCATGELQRVQALVEEDGSRINAWSPDGFPPLGLAAFFGHPGVVQYLLSKGTDVHAQARNPAMVRPIHGAVARRDLAITTALLQHGADPNATQQKGFTPLHVAAANGDRVIVEVLLAYCAETSPVSEDGRTPAMMALEKGHSEIAALLQSQSQSVNP